MSCAGYLTIADVSVALACRFCMFDVVFVLLFVFLFKTLVAGVSRSVSTALLRCRASWDGLPCLYSWMLRCG